MKIRCLDTLGVDDITLFKPANARCISGKSSPLRPNCHQNVAECCLSTVFNASLAYTTSLICSKRGISYRHRFLYPASVTEVY